jgi:hypothetical protein
MKTETRFQISTPRTGLSPVQDPRANESYALSIAVSFATNPDAKPGTWTVLEYDEPIYTVTRLAPSDAPLLVMIREGS